MDAHTAFMWARFAAAFTNLGLGLTVFLTRPHRRQNQLVAALLLFNFFIHVLIGLIPVLPSAMAYALFAPAFLSMILYVSTYLVFIGTLPTPLARPFSGRWAVRVVVALGALMAMSLFAVRQVWYAPAASAPADPIAAGWDGLLQSFVLKNVLELIILLHFVYGFVATFHAFLRAREPVERRKMKWFAAAFGSHDVLLAISFGMGLGFDATGNTCVTCDLVAFYILISVAGVLMAAFMAYGILATQLFDIDLRIKRGISRSTLVAIFLAVFVGIAAATEEYLNDAYGLLAGGLAAATLVVALGPLQRLADRVSDAAMPHVTATPEYLDRRKREIYQAALQSARHDGDVTARERRVLATLADELGITATEAHDMEGLATDQAGA